MPETLSLAILLFKQVFALDFQGPNSLFSFLTPDGDILKMLPHAPAYHIETSYFAETADPVDAAGGPKLVPTRTYASVKPGEQFDMILIPGGASRRAAVPRTADGRSQAWARCRGSPTRP